MISFHSQITLFCYVLKPRGSSNKSDMHTQEGGWTWTDCFDKNTCKIQLKDRCTVQADKNCFNHYNILFKQTTDQQSIHFWVILKTSKCLQNWEQSQQEYGLLHAQHDGLGRSRRLLVYNTFEDQMTENVKAAFWQSDSCNPLMIPQINEENNAVDGRQNPWT